MFAVRGKGSGSADPGLERSWLFPSASHFVISEVQLKVYNWGFRIEVGVQGSRSGGYLVPATAASTSVRSSNTLGAVHAVCAGGGCFDQVCGDVSTRLRTASPLNHI